MNIPDEVIPEEVKKQALEEATGKTAEGTAEKAAKKTADASEKSSKKHDKTNKTNSAAKVQVSPSGDSPRQETSHRRPFQKTRAGVPLSKAEVKAIKKGRRKLRKEMRAKGLRRKEDFELTAGTLGLYFDKKNLPLAWFMRHWLVALLGGIAGLLAVLFIFSLVQQMRGRFTINLSEGMFRKGFTLSESVGFDNPTTQLFANPAEDVPCISINQIPTDIDEIDGEHNDQYFAYTFYIRNEGDDTVAYEWSLNINEETQDVSDSVWVMIFEDGEMRFYAKANGTTGEAEALPAFGDDTRGYISLPIMQLAPDSGQFQVIQTKGQITYWRVVPYKFVSDSCVAEGKQDTVDPMDVHKYTVVFWLEGDDESTDDSKIGGHIGMELNFQLVEEDEENGVDGNSKGSAWKEFWEGIWDNLEFWK
jgi:hypothetical protein